MKKETPIPVTVARWSALGAIITVVGSMFNTIWTERPWWANNTVTNHSVSPMMSENAVAMSIGTSSGFSTSTWIMIAAGVVISASLVVEYFHRKK